MLRALFLGAVAVLVVGGLYLCFCRERPYVLTRLTAARAIEAKAEFQHKTKLYFTIGQAEASRPSCDNFEFSPDKISIFRHYLATGEMQFSPYRNQIPPFDRPSLTSLQLSSEAEHLLIDNIDDCKVRDVTATTGAYELTLGRAKVKVIGIRKEGGQAFADFEWHFEPLNDFGQNMPDLQTVRERELADSRTTAEEKRMAPFWVGSAELAKYDDGWRVTTVNLSPSHYVWGNWEYGPGWPDENFDWHTFDEHENRFVSSRRK